MYNFAKFIPNDATIKSFEKLWTEKDFDHFREYMKQSVRTYIKEHPGEGKTYPDNLASVFRTGEERKLIQLLILQKDGDLPSIEQLERWPFSKVAREYLGIDVEKDINKDYFKYFSRR